MVKKNKVVMKSVVETLLRLLVDVSILLRGASRPTSKM